MSTQQDSRPRKQEKLRELAVFLTALALYSSEWLHSLSYGYQKGGLSILSAERVLNGDLPYRDFWTIYAPGQFYLLASLLKTFGNHLLVERVAAALICSLAAWMAYRLVVKLTDDSLLASFCAAIFVAGTIREGYWSKVGSYPPAILLVLTALNLMLLYYRSGKRVHLIMAGVCAGAVVIFKHDVGGYTATAICVGLTVYWLLSRWHAQDQSRSLVSELAIFAVSAAAIVLPVAAIFAVLTGPEMLDDLIVFPLTEFRFTRGEHYPSALPFALASNLPSLMRTSLFELVNSTSNYLVFAVPFAMLILGLIAAGMAVFYGHRREAAVAVTFATGFLLHFNAAHIQINTHIITMSLYGFFLGAVFLEQIKERLARGLSKWQKLTIITLLFTWLLAVASMPIHRAMSWNQRSASHVKLDLKKVSGFSVPQSTADTWVEIKAYIDEMLPSAQPIFVGMHRHDILVTHDSLLYYVLNRLPAIRHHELHPGRADTSPVQREIISELTRADVSTLILVHAFDDEALDQLKERHIKNLPMVGATDLDEFIHENFQHIQTVSRYEIWQRLE